MSGTVASSTKTKTTKYVYRSSGGANTDVSNVSIEYSSDLSALSRMEDRIRLLQEDLETERELRQRVERERSDLSVQVIQLSERLEEAEGGAESQFEINRKREAELAKLRKLLEEVHLESEENVHILKKKHQESLADFQDQLEIITKSKIKIEKEKVKVQQELYELLSQLENSNKDRVTFQKTVEKLEVTIHEYSLKIEELSRTVVDLQTFKSRISQENFELTKTVQDLKVSIENVTYLKGQVTAQLDDSRRRLEDEDRRRSQLEGQLHSYEIELESVRVQLEEESEARLDIERQLSKMNGEVLVFKGKYESEVRGRQEEVEEIRKKFTIRITELEEHIEAYIIKINGLEKQKSRLQSEVEILIIDLEKANGAAREFQKRSEHLERISSDLKSKLDELTILYEKSQTDIRNKTTELIRVGHELDKARDQREALARDNKKLESDNHDLKNQIADLTRRYHEIEIEVRRLENEREELASAYKEAEAARKTEEARAQRLSTEFGAYKHETERRLADKEEELDSIRKRHSVEMEQLNIRVVEAETKLRTEITRIKKKYQCTITELELTIDVANKNNICLQQTVKKQSLSLAELQGLYEEAQRGLQMALDQLSATNRRVQSLQAELDEAKSNLDNANRAKRQAEIHSEELVIRVNELTNINVTISSTKIKLEQELNALASDYDEVSKELKMCDDRAQKAQNEAKHAIEILHEEQERVVKIESIKKSLEIEIKNLTIRLEEVESSTLVNSKRIISKLEARVRDIEIELDEERRRHAETVKILRKKERQVKEYQIQGDEDHKNISLLQESVDKLNEKIKVYKRQLNETEGMSQSNLTRVRRFQRELEAAEERADSAETNLNFVRAKHRTFVTAIPGGQTTQTVYVTEESSRVINDSSY